MRNRMKQRENRRMKYIEEKLEKYNNFGVRDLTPYNAVNKIRTNGKSEISYK